MSLINDALKKAEKDSNEGKDSGETLKPENPEHLQKKAAKSRDEGGNILLVIILMTIVIASGIMYWTRNRDPLFASKSEPSQDLTQNSAEARPLPIWEQEDPLNAAIERVKEEVQPEIARDSTKSLSSEEDLLPPADLFEMEKMQAEAQALANSEKTEEENPEDALIAKIIEVATQRGKSSNSSDEESNIDENKAPVKTFHLNKRDLEEGEEVLRFNQKNKSSISEEEIFVNSAQITGVMFSGSESKVLMNNRVFSINSIVHPKTGLKLSEIQPHKIIFTDAAGREYTRSL